MLHGMNIVQHVREVGLQVLIIPYERGIWLGRDDT